MGTLATVGAVAGTLLGWGLWLAGARFSRYVITLATVTLGTLLGREVPTALGWALSPAIGAVLGALAFGFAGYVFHRFWVSLGLGGVLVCWTALGTWLVFGSSDWTWPAAEGMTWAAFLQTVWERLPDDVRRILPIAAVTSMLTGITVAVVWPRVALVMLYSLAGVSLLLGMGAAALECLRHDWLGRIPADSAAQLASLLVLVLIGAAIQWRLTPSSKPRAGEAKE